MEDISEEINSHKVHYKIANGDFNAEIGEKSPSQNNSNFIGYQGLGNRKKRGKICESLEQERMDLNKSGRKTKKEIGFIIANISKIH